MKLLTARGFGELVLEDVEPPTIGPGQVLVRTRVSAVSAGTERRMLYGRAGDVREHAPDFPVPGAFGYLAAGDVMEVGRDVVGLAPGDRVSCGRAWGAHRELLDTDAGSVIKIPDTMSYLEGAASYWAVPPMAGILAGAPRLYADTAVIGLGPLGLCAVQMLVPMSRRVAAIDLVATRVELAARYGAVGIDGSDRDPTEAVRDAMPLGPEVVIEASGTQAGLELALEIARPLARIALVGVPPPLQSMNLFWPMQVKGLKLVPLHREGAASPQGGGPGSPRQTYLPDVLDMITNERLDIEGLTSWVVPPERAAEAMALLHHHPARTVGAAIAWDPGEVRALDRFEAAVADG
jgi:threonine dehydrogenase-like Zn-dependent dehydrogenase